MIKKKRIPHENYNMALLLFFGYKSSWRCYESTCLSRTWKKSIEERPIPTIQNSTDAIVKIVKTTRIIVWKPTSPIPYHHMAIHPYPDYLISSFEIENKKIILRPIRPEDAELEQAFISDLSNQSKYFRFMENIKELSPTMLVRFTQIDYDKEMAIVSCYMDEEKEIIIGIARYVINPDGETAEFAIVIADAWHKKGIGSKLLASLISIAKDKGVKSIEGVVLSSNTGMLELARHHRFKISSCDDPTVKFVKKAIQD